jgi:hypothetical protein
MDDLIAHIYELRKEGIPLHYRRRKEGKKTVWYIHYGYTLIAYRADTETATQAVSIATDVHRVIHERLAKAT